MIEDVYEATQGNLSPEDQYELCRTARIALTYSETLEKELETRIDKLFPDITQEEVTS